MTAYELADKLLANLTQEYDCDKYMEQAANMLRQQAEKIKVLEKCLLQAQNACIQLTNE